MKLKILVINFLIFGNFFLACGDRPLFTELAENRVKVIIKGTYESNNPRGWNNFPVSSADSVYVYTAAPDGDPDVFMLDIAGMKVASGKHDQYFANYRKTFLSPLDDSNDFFNGTGCYYRNTDMRPNFEWQSVKMYIRKMIFNNAIQYQPNGVTGWDYDNDIEVIFREENTYGFNFNLYQILTYYDFLKENYSEINRIFPLNIPVEDGFVFDYNEKETMLEIRLVVKNFIKKYEYEYINSDGNRKLRHFYALSDWLRNIKKDEAGKGLMGGNIITAARYWVPGKTASIYGTATTNRYVVAIKSGHNKAEYEFGSTERTRPSCDAPKAPREPVYSSDETSAYLEELLNYYLQYESYKEDYDAFVDCVDTIDEYETAWNDYNTNLKSFKIPQISTWCSDGSFILTNVPSGTYNIFESDTDPDPGNLPDSFTPIGTATIDESSFGQPVNMQSK